MSRSLGTDAEDRAAQYLFGEGYTILTRRFKARHGEIDIVALDGETLVIVEVKRRSGRFGRPEEGVGRTKRQRLRAAAREYVEKTGEYERTVRFDLIAIDPDGLRHYPDGIRIDDIE